MFLPDVRKSGRREKHFWRLSYEPVSHLERPSARHLRTSGAIPEIKATLPFLTVSNRPDESFACSLECEMAVGDRSPVPLQLRVRFLQSHGDPEALQGRSTARFASTATLALATVWSVFLPGLVARNASGQKPVAPQPGMGGIASAGTFAPVYDSANRPITAGGLVESGTAVFVDVTQAAGLASWRHVMGTSEKKYILETNGLGVGLIDYDNDGWLDIYLVNGSTYKALDGKETPPHAALFHNNHDGTFTDVAAKAGVTNDRWGFGVAIADYDNDGWPDIYVSNWGKNRLYHNNGDGTFTDVSEKAGVADEPGYYGLGAVFADINNDGKPDLLVGNDSTPNYLYLNKGNGTFEDVSYASGFALN